MDRLEPYLIRHNVDLRRDWPILNDCFMTVRRDRGDVVISVCRGLMGPDVVEAVGVQIARLELQHPCHRSGWISWRDHNREWREALRWLSRTLVSEFCLERAEALGLEPWELAEELHVTERLVYLAYQERERRRGKVVPFFNPATDIKMYTDAQRRNV